MFYANLTSGKKYKMEISCETPSVYSPSCCVTGSDAAIQSILVLLTGVHLDTEGNKIRQGSR